MTIRKAEAEDLDGIMVVISDVNEEAQKESKEKISERISEDQLLIYEIDQKIIGFLGWNSKYQNNPDNWYLEQITIHKDYRGQGIGKDFIRYFLDFCRKNGVKKVYAHVQDHNTPSLNMFLNTGWEINDDLDKKADKEKRLNFLFEFILKRNPGHTVVWSGQYR